MVTDRRVTKNGNVFDPDANKNIVNAHINAAVAIGYTGVAYIGLVPTDQWIAQTLTGFTFPEGARGRGTIPVLMTTNYQNDYLGLSVQKLRDRLNEVCQRIPNKYRNGWICRSFDLVITGFEWNRGTIRPYLRGLSKPRNGNTFVLSKFDRNWHFPQAKRIPIQMFAAPSGNIDKKELGMIEEQLKLILGDRLVTGKDAANDAEKLLVKTIQDISARSKYVGSDVMSILIPSPLVPNPTIRIRYLPADRNKGFLVKGKTKKPVPVAYSPWVISPGCIRSPAIFTNCQIQSMLGPYRVVIEGPSNENTLRAVSSQVRPEI